MAEAQAAAPRREYETIYVLRPDISKEGAEKISNRVSDVKKREGGTLTQVESWGRRSLAFPVSNHRRAYYVYLKYVGGGQVVSELERNFRMLEGVLKYQTVKLRDEVDLATVQIAPGDVEFEAIEPPLDEEPEETLAEQLGLQEPPARDRGTDGGDESAEAGGGREKSEQSTQESQTSSDEQPADTEASKDDTKEESQ
jgi:small subunit ribosomal protein S6